MPAHKLHYKTEFQGLSISIENRKGSKRHWYDVSEDREGTTVMKFPYGYIRGTLGTDGDAVDVYLGNDKDSNKVFIITQNKAPEFEEIDEQKVMLGFSTSDKAKLAYLAHFDKPEFFRDIKELPLEEFKAKLLSRKGKLIKGALLDLNNSVRIGDTTMEKSFDSPSHVNKDKKSMTKAYEDLQDIAKALRAAFANSISRRARLDAKAAAVRLIQPVATPVSISVDDVPLYAGIAEDQPLIGTSREREASETVVVPVRSIHNAVMTTPQESTVYKSCSGCGRMSKSLTCTICANSKEAVATPVWRR